MFLGKQKSKKKQLVILENKKIIIAQGAGGPAGARVAGAVGGIDA